MALLDRTTATLPSRWYYDPAQYARELEAVWYRDWVCVGRLDDLRESGDYIVETVGDESLDPDARPRGPACAPITTPAGIAARGSCSRPRGRFANGRIVCPLSRLDLCALGRAPRDAKDGPAGGFPSR